MTATCENNQCFHGWQKLRKSQKSMHLRAVFFKNKYIHPAPIKLKHEDSSGGVREGIFLDLSWQILSRQILSRHILPRQFISRQIISEQIESTRINSKIYLDKSKNLPSHPIPHLYSRSTYLSKSVCNITLITYFEYSKKNLFGILQHYDNFVFTCVNIVTN